MNNFFILTPTFNDWRSLNRVLQEIDKKVSKIQGKFSVIVVNDASTTKPNLSIKGFKYLKTIKKKSIIIVIDSDGEDDPKKIKELINLAQKNPQSVITANRLKRTENIFFYFVYKMHLLITLILTGKYINFGNYSAFNSKNLNKLLRGSDLFLAYSAKIAKNIKSIKPCYMNKKKRYYDKSKVKILFLIQHSINIISLFKLNVLKLSILVCLFLMLLSLMINNFFIYFIIIFIIIFNILINYINKPKIENYLSLINSIENYKN